MPPDRLNIRQIQGVQPKLNPFKLSDGGGLYLLVNPNGAKYWRLKYRYAGKERLLALGVYPKVSLKEARIGRNEARRILVAGGDPVALKRETVKQSRSLASMALTFQLSMAGDALTIHANGETFKLTPDQTAAVRSFLMATPCEGLHHETE